jgi:hypothetical protein
MWSIHLSKSVTSVPLQQPCVCVYFIFPIPILKSLYTIESLTNVLITVTFMAESFLRKSECEFLALPCGIVLIVVPKILPWCLLYKTLAFCHLGRFLPRLLPVSHILAQLTKSWQHESCVERSSAIKVVHYIITCASHHTICTMCIITAPSHKHELTRASRIWARVWVPNTTLSATLITLSLSCASIDLY